MESTALNETAAREERPLGAPGHAPGHAPAESSAHERSHALSRPLIIAGLIAAVALTALDVTIVATAMPTIAGVLGGLPLYPLVVAAFLLTSTTTVPFYGKMLDMYGRKPVFLVGAGLIVTGSVLCALSWNMPSLIVFRAVQGLGAGAVLPASLTLIGDLFDVEERARMQGVFGSVWGVSSVVGPLIGGLIVQYADWRWVFLINVPVAALSSFLIFRYLREPKVHSRERVDVAGALTLTFGLGLLLVGVQVGGRSGWLSVPTLLTLAGAAVLLAAFGYIEQRASAPLLSLGLLRRPIIAVPCLAGLLLGAVLIGFEAYVPLLVQGSWGGTPVEAGLMIAPLSIGWPLASASSGRFVRRFGYRRVVIGGVLTLLVGTLTLLTLTLPFVSSEDLLRRALMIISVFVSGAGFGFSTTSMLIAVQNSVLWGERGVATASVQFFRNMGNTVGASLLGTVLTTTLAAALTSPPVRGAAALLPAAAIRKDADPTLGPANVLFDLGVRDTLSPAVRSALAGALSGSLGWVFLGIAVLALCGAIVATRFPREVKRVT